jgi:hypothetical protein
MCDELHLQCNTYKAIRASKFSVKAFPRNISHVSFHFSFLFFSFRNMELSSKTHNNFLGYSHIPADCLLKSFCLPVCTRIGSRECLKKKSPTCCVLLSFSRRLKWGKPNDTLSRDIGYACLCASAGYKELPIIPILNEKKVLTDFMFC